MNAELTDLLAACPACDEEVVTWAHQGRPLPLRVTTHLSTKLPPDALITSVRAVVLRRNKLVVVRDPHGHHVLPGGRREPPDEPLEQALRREILEETGLRIGPAEPIGFLCFQHLAARPEGYRYPHPHFAQAVFAARTDDVKPSPREGGEFELDVFFRHADALDELKLSQRDRALLRETLHVLRG